MLRKVRPARESARIQKLSRHVFRGEMFFDDLEELIYIERFGHIGSGAIRHKFVDSPLDGVGAEHDDRNVARAVVGLETRENLGAVYVRQMRIEQNEIGAMEDGQLDANRALHGGGELELGLGAQKMCDQREVGSVVLDVEQMCSLI